MREQVLKYIREKRLVRPGYRVCAAVSGGADSVALLRVLLELRDELGIVVSAAHFNHQLRGDASEADEAFVADLARHHELSFFAGRGDVCGFSERESLSVEAAARRLRYEWLAQLAAEQRFDRVATGHTLDDQAETVLMKFLRGAGTQGLAGIYPELGTRAETRSEIKEQGVYSTPEGVPFQNGEEPTKAVVKNDAMKGHSFTCSAQALASASEAMAPQSETAPSRSTRIIRPLLCVSRVQVESYLASLQQEWREDESNLDHRFRRNRVRHELLPLLERDYNTNLRQVLSEAAEVARAEEEYWQALTQKELSRRTPTSSGSPALDVAGFAAMPTALQRRVLKHFLKKNGIAADFEHVESLLRCATSQADASGRRQAPLRTKLPGGSLASRQGEELRLSHGDQSTGTPPLTYSYRLPIPGLVEITELGVVLQAVVVPEKFAREAPAGTLLAANLVGSELTIRNWQPGDRYAHAQADSSVKVKELFSYHKVAAEQRPLWPLAVCGGEIVWLASLYGPKRDFPVARAYCWSGTGHAIKIEQRAAMAT